VGNHLFVIFAVLDVSFAVNSCLNRSYFTFILLRSTLTLWQCATKVISVFLIFAVLVLRVNDCRPYTPF